MVIVPSPLLMPHAIHHGLVTCWLVTYQSRTPGVTVADNATTILSDENEFQPDALLVLDSACGGQSRIEGGYLVGPPELVVEERLQRADSEQRRPPRIAAVVAIQQRQCCCLGLPSRRRCQHEDVLAGQDRWNRGALDIGERVPAELPEPGGDHRRTDAFRVGQYDACISHRQPLIGGLDQLTPRCVQRAR